MVIEIREGERSRWGRTKWVCEPTDVMCMDHVILRSVSLSLSLAMQQIYNHNI